MSDECNSLLVIRIRGGVKASRDELATLKMLNLTRANRATIIPKTPSFIGMLKKVEHYITWGCLLYTSPSPRDLSTSRMPSSA